MSLPADWVEYIFSKLTLTYGRDFLSRWEGLSAEDVKADWAHELDGFDSHPALIEHALKHLPERAPTVIEFRRIARGGPDIQPNRPRLEAPTPATRESRQRLLAGLQPILRRPARDPLQWARELLRDHEAGHRNGREFRSTPCALAMARDALGAPAFTEEATA